MIGGSNGRFVAGLCFVLVAGSANAQTSPQAMILSALSDCFKDAIGAGATEVDGDALTFSCTAAKAKALYNFVGEKVRAEIVADRNGKFENRQFGNCACYHRIEDQSGGAADEFRCDLTVAVGSALSQ